MPDTAERHYTQTWTFDITLEPNSSRDLLQVHTDGPWIMPDSVSIQLRRLDDAQGKDYLRVRVAGRRIKSDGTPGRGVSSIVFYRDDQMPGWLTRLLAGQFRQYVPGWEET